MPEHPDLVRLQKEYTERARRPDAAGRYSLFNPAHLFLVQQRQRAVLQCLRRCGFYPLAGRRILELGCGSGGVLLEMLSSGAAAGKLHGAELRFGSVQAAIQALSSLPLVCADGQNLPYAEQSFDLTMQFTVFSSILDHEVKQKLAREMRRVTRPGGMILWYDFWLNPTNPQTLGICPAEIKKLFPRCRFRFERITLAPPLARRIVPISWVMALALEKLHIFNTHYLIAIQPEG